MTSESYENSRRSHEAPAQRITENENYEQFLTSPITFEEYFQKKHVQSKYISNLLFTNALNSLPAILTSAMATIITNTQLFWENSIQNDLISVLLCHSLILLIIMTIVPLLTYNLLKRINKDIRLVLRFIIEGSIKAYQAGLITFWIAFAFIHLWLKVQENKSDLADENFFPNNSSDFSEDLKEDLISSNYTNWSLQNTSMLSLSKEESSENDFNVTLENNVILSSLSNFSHEIQFTNNSNNQPTRFQDGSLNNPLIFFVLLTYCMIFGNQMFVASIILYYKIQLKHQNVLFLSVIFSLFVLIFGSIVFSAEAIGRGFLVTNNLQLVTSTIFSIIAGSVLLCPFRSLNVNIDD